MGTNPFDVTTQVGRVVEAESFERAEKPYMMTLRIDLGDRTVQSAVQLGYHYEPSEVAGRLVLCATDLDPLRVAGFKSEVLTLSVPSESDYPILVEPERDVPLGGELY